MDRQIKFRGKQKEWEYGGYYYSEATDQHFIVNDNGEFEVRPETVGQFVGEFRGKELYEGDIVKYALDNIEPEAGQTEYIEEITFNDGGFCLDNYTPVHVLNDWDFEILGNTTDHPHLINNNNNG